jgi:hypothetical protein
MIQLLCPIMQINIYLFALHLLVIKENKRNKKILMNYCRYKKEFKNLYNI